MGLIENREAMSLPNGFSSHLILNAPTFSQVNTGEHQDEPIFVSTEDGPSYLFSVGGVISIGENHLLYRGRYMLSDLRRSFSDVEGDSYLLILNEGTSAHEAEIWTEDKTTSPSK
jgi:hypothetical protein